MKFNLIAAILGFLIAIPGAVSAQNPDDQVPDQDSQVAPAPSVQGPMSQGSNDPGSGNQSSSAPAPAETNAGVARISLIHGDVSTQRGDSKDWSAAALNAPVLAGDRVSTGDKGRIELQLDYANIFRLAERSQANITTLTRSQIQIQLGRGMANYSVFKNSDRSAGFPLDRATVSIPGMAGMAGASALPGLTRTTAAVLLRCTAARGFRTCSLRCMTSISAAGRLSQPTSSVEAI